MNIIYESFFFKFQPLGPGKYIFDVGCMQFGEYISVEQVKKCFLYFLCYLCLPQFL